MVSSKSYYGGLLVYNGILGLIVVFFLLRVLIRKSNYPSKKIYYRKMILIGFFFIVVQNFSVITFYPSFLFLFAYLINYPLTNRIESQQ
jgi:hypothetical protein